MLYRLISLGHKDKDRIRAVYNRAQYLEERREMLQYWADYLDSLRVGADIILPKKQLKINSSKKNYLSRKLVR